MKTFRILFFLMPFLWLASCVEEEREINYDIAKPTIAIDQSVYQTARTKGETFYITGTVSDESALTTIRVSNSAWGIDSTITLEDAMSYSLNFEVEIPENADLSVRNVITVEAVDKRRNESTMDVFVNFGNDEEAPSITINSPTTESGELYAGIPVDIDVEVADNFALETISVTATELSFSRSINGSGSATYHFIAAGENGIDISPLLEPGVYEVSVTATDMAGNATTVTSSYTVIETPITYTTIGIIGNATPGGWDGSTAMYLPDPNDTHNWEIITKLNAGEMKFRADNSWTVNWGASDFPTGNGVQNGANIPIANAGYYKITFNDRTGAYTFEALTPVEYTTVGIIGNATPGGWDGSTALTQDGTDPHVWTATMTLTAGEAKFRADNAWTVNWGASTFPDGRGVLNGPNIPVAAGVYKITFNDVSGVYSFELQSIDVIYLVGDATPAGWSNNSNITMFRDLNNGLRFTYTGYFNSGYFKFLKTRGAWQPQWGKGSGDGVLGYNPGNTSDPDAIQIANAGYYTVTVDVGASTYSVTGFDASSSTTYTTIGIIGSATAGGWGPTDTDMVAASSDPHLWYIDGAVLSSGEMKFRAENGWDINWGAATFPYGIGTGGGPNIPISDAGDYLIVFSDLTGQYAIIKK